MEDETGENTFLVVNQTVSVGLMEEVCALPDAVSHPLEDRGDPLRVLREIQTPHSRSPILYSHVIPRNFAACLRFRYCFIPTTVPYPWITSQSASVLSTAVHGDPHGEPHGVPSGATAIGACWSRKGL